MNKIIINLPEITCKMDLIVNLRFMYFLMLASEDLLVTATDLSGLDYFKNKLEEERGHAKWLHDDIKSLGENTDGLDSDAANIAGSQYYYIKHVNPLMLLGYMAVMECSPMPLSNVDKLESLYGKLPTLRYHAEHDIKHGEEVILEISKVTNQELQSKILFNSFCTANAISTVMNARFKGVNNAIH